MSRVWSCNEWDQLEEVIVGNPLHARFPTPDRSTQLAEFPDRSLAEIPRGPFPQQIIEETEEDLNEFIQVLKDLRITVKRGAETKELTTSSDRLAEGVLGVKVVDDFPIQSARPIASARHAVRANVEIVRLTGKALGQVVARKRSMSNTISGPLGIYQAAATQVERLGWEGVFQMIGFLSLNLGIFNLLPIPVLDGGAIFLLLIEAALAAVGKTLSTTVRERIQQVGLVFVILLMVFVLTNDVLKSLRWNSSNTKPAATTNDALPAGKSRAVKVKDIQIGGGAPVVRASMTKTDTADAGATGRKLKKWLRRFEVCGWQFGQRGDRLERDFQGNPNVPRCRHSLSLQVGTDGPDAPTKLRLNLRNIGSEERIGSRHRPGGRGPIGVNGGSLEGSAEETWLATPEAMVESALRRAKILEDLDFARCYLLSPDVHTRSRPTGSWPGRSLSVSPLPRSGHGFYRHGQIGDWPGNSFA
jgi:hypothetical protein